MEYDSDSLRARSAWRNDPVMIRQDGFTIDVLAIVSYYIWQTVNDRVALSHMDRWVEWMKKNPHKITD